MDEFKHCFGQRIKELRRSKHLTQEQLAENIGMDTQNLCKMENGNHFPQVKNIIKLAKILDVEVKELFDFNHFYKKEVLIKEISKYLKYAKNKDVEIVYKFIKNLEQYNK